MTMIYSNILLEYFNISILENDEARPTEDCRSLAPNIRSDFMELKMLYR